MTDLKVVMDRQRVEEALGVTRQRRDWLGARIEAKQKVGWDVEWDMRERDAHAVLVVLAEAVLAGVEYGPSNAEEAVANGR